jgi:ribosomal protein S1
MRVIVTAHIAGSSTEWHPHCATLCRATVASVRPFGVFVRPEGHPQDALVHASQVNEQLSFSREDEDGDKVKALEFFAPPHSQVQRTSVPRRFGGLTVNMNRTSTSACSSAGG